MQRCPFIAFLLVIVLPFVLTCHTAAQEVSPQELEDDSETPGLAFPNSDQPPDITPYDHTLSSEEAAAEAEAAAQAAPLPAGVVVIDIVVTNKGCNP
jgi:hypothetical protein